MFEVKQKQETEIIKILQFEGLLKFVVAYM